MVEDMKISHIVAIGINGEIGKDNDLLWGLRGDLRRFKDTTMNHCMLMGRKTYQSIGKPLNGRISIIVTRDKDYSVRYTNNVFVVNSIEEGIELAKNLNEKELMIIGGAEIYSQTMNIVDNIYVTKVWDYFYADSFYPETEFSDFNIVKQVHNKPSDTGDKFSYTFCDLVRK